MNSLPLSAAQNSSCDEAPTPIGYFKTRRKGRSAGLLEKNGSAPGEDLADKVININFQKSSRAFHVELSTAGTSAALHLYEECTMDELKRTARSLAMQNDSVEEGEEGRHVTSDKLPLITAPLRLTAGCAHQTNKQPQRRSLLAPPRTRLLGFSDAEALLNIIESTQERRSRELEKQSREQAALNESACSVSYCPRKTNLDLQALARPGVLKKALQKTFRAARRQLARLLDKLALA